MSVANDARRSQGDAIQPNSLVGDVLEIISSDSPGRVLVRWRMLDGVLNERWLPVVRGLTLNQGDLVLLHRPDNWHEWLVTHAIGGGMEPAPAPQSATSALIDNKRIEIEGQDEVVLRCGKASITLRRNGRVVIRGAYVESRSDGTNRIKGGNVQIN
jgi:hypothetical protein